MEKPIVAESAPTVPTQLKLFPEFAQRMAQGMQAVAVPAVTTGVVELLSELGIPGEPEVTWEPNNDESAEGRPLAIHVNGQLCRYSDELMLLLYSYVLGKVVLPFDALRGLRAWLTSAEEHLVTKWLALLCRHALGRRAGLLLGAEQARAYCCSLGLSTGARTNDLPRLMRMLAHVLDLGIAIPIRRCIERP